MIPLTESRVDRALLLIEPGLKQYCWIQRNVRRNDVSHDGVFQRKFNAFYKVRRNYDWRCHFYTLLERSKASGITFADALRVLIDRTSRIEASFTSKLVATLHPNRPVIDRYVLSNFGMRLPSGDNRERRCIDCYEQLCDRYAVLMKRAEGKMILEKFNRMFPHTRITDLKKLDLVLWQIRD